LFIRGNKRKTKGPDIRVGISGMTALVDVFISVKLTMCRAGHRLNALETESLFLKFFRATNVIVLTSYPLISDNRR